MTKPQRLWVERPDNFSPPTEEEIAVATRIGLPAGRGDDLPLRYLIASSRFVSRPGGQRILPLT